MSVFKDSKYLKEGWCDLCLMGIANKVCDYHSNFLHNSLKALEALGGGIITFNKELNCNW